MFRKGLFTSAALFGCAVVVMAHVASAEAAAPAKKKAPAASAAKLAYGCEGIATSIASNAVVGDVRDSSQFGFKTFIDFGSKTATILGVQGSVRVKAGRYRFTVSDKKLSIQIPWTDNNGNPQVMSLSIAPDGEFWSDVDVPVKTLSGAGALGALFSEMYQMSYRAEYSGLCLRAN